MINIYYYSKETIRVSDEKKERKRKKTEYESPFGHCVKSIWAIHL